MSNMVLSDIAYYLFPLFTPTPGPPYCSSSANRKFCIYRSNGCTSPNDEYRAGTYCTYNSHSGLWSTAGWDSTRTHWTCTSITSTSIPPPSTTARTCAPPSTTCDSSRRHQCTADYCTRDSDGSTNRTIHNWPHSASGADSTRPVCQHSQ